MTMQVYSYIEPTDGEWAFDTHVINPDDEPPQYLMEYEGRHYIATDRDLSVQDARCDFQGPHDLNADTTLKEQLQKFSEPMLGVMQKMREERPKIYELLECIMQEFKERQTAGESLSTELVSALTKWQMAEDNNPKPDYLFSSS